MQVSTAMKFPDAFPQPIPYISKSKLHCNLPDEQIDLPVDILTSLIFKYIPSDYKSCPICGTPKKAFQKHIKKCQMRSIIQEFITPLILPIKIPIFINNFNERYTPAQILKFTNPTDCNPLAIHIYTDGSDQYSNAFSYVYYDPLLQFIFTTMHSVTLCSTITNHSNRLETKAIYFAIHMLTTAWPKILSTRPIQLFTDSQGAVLDFTSLKYRCKPPNWDWS